MREEMRQVVANEVAALRDEVLISDDGCDDDDEGDVAAADDGDGDVTADDDGGQRSGRSQI